MTSGIIESSNNLHTNNESVTHNNSEYASTFESARLESHNDDDESCTSTCSITVAIAEPAHSQATKATRSLRNQERDSISTWITAHSSQDISFNAKQRDDYVRSGAHLKSLLGNAFLKISKTYTNVESYDEGRSTLCLKPVTHENDDDDDDDDDEDDQFVMKKRKRKGTDTLTCRKKPNSDNHHHDEANISNNKHASEIAKQKTAEVLSLKRALKEAEEHAAAMSHANTVLRDASSTASSRMERISEALRIAGQNASNARADADAAEARASILESQLNSMKTVLENVKRTCEQVKSEHDEISSVSRTLEGRLLQSEYELNKIGRQKRQVDEDRQLLREKLCNTDQEMAKLESRLQEKEETITKMQKNISERDDIERARIDRTHRIENEVRDARAMLIEATSAAAEAESTTTVLKDTIQELQSENSTLHEKIRDTIDMYSKERARLQETLSTSEREIQKLKMKVLNDEEEFERHKLDRMTSEKEILQLKNRITNLERRLTEALSSNNNDMPMYIDSTTPVSSVATSFGNDDDLSYSPSSDFAKELQVTLSNNNNTSAKADSIIIPPLRTISPKVSKASSKPSHHDDMSVTSIVKRNTSGTTSSMTSNKCSVCSKNAYGIMQACQCGKADCDKRAHVVCLIATNPLPSVSHPGTPARSKRHILCDTCK